ncbi:cupin domain-containing protein [Flavobacterium wongokense]|uniref:cupin domain-containing protein n=1 Tax=Flavobacterium wongokense TaxID=2910674 RepID=UPI001F373A56|nr:cupin domain-containing protein [Flavobacterium sp. WG47]MCF6132904.1 cupin domain-containing protein [Flavobacterium sp. WG47]
MKSNISLMLTLIFWVAESSSAQGMSSKEFNSINPEKITWKSFPAFPDKVKLAVLVGNPAKTEPFIVRVKVPDGEKIMPHVHPEDRIYTVISGVFYIGIGEKFDETKLKAYAPGSVIILPGNTPHFHWAKSGEYVTQVYAIGPLGLEYLDKEYDPRLKSRK